MSKNYATCHLERRQINMNECSVSDVTVILEVGEKKVRRWIREGKLPATRTGDCGELSIALKDIVERANRKPHLYHEPMINWLLENDVEFSVQKELQEVRTINSDYLRRRCGDLYALKSGTIPVPKIVLTSSQ